MPKNGIHTFVGAGAGFFTALHHAGNQRPTDQVLEAAGGALGGVGGGRLPDLIEPSDSPWHRGPAHSMTLGGLILAAAPLAMEWETVCRSAAERHRAAAEETSGNPLLCMIHSLAEVLFRILAGLLAGLGIGYLSHLMLDALTPASIPVT